MIEALARVLVKAIGLPLVQGLGYLLLHGLRLRRIKGGALFPLLP